FRPGRHRVLDGLCLGVTTGGDEHVEAARASLTAAPAVGGAGVPTVVEAGATTAGAERQHESTGQYHCAVAATADSLVGHRSLLWVVGRPPQAIAAREPVDSRTRRSGSSKMCSGGGVVAGARSSRRRATARS